jgi:serine protease Do
MIEGLDTGIGFAVPINLAKRVKDHLISEGKFTRSWLGIGIHELKNDSDYLSLDGKLAPDVREGVVVTVILPGGPASKSDLRPGDVITAVDGKTVQTVRQLRDEVAVKKPGRVAVLDVVRGKEHLTVKVTPGVMPGRRSWPPKHAARSAIEPAGLGLTVQGLTKELAQQYGVEVIAGVLVTAVEQDSPADLHGIKPGDVITEINRQRVSTPRQFRDALKSADPKRGLMVNLVSEGEQPVRGSQRQRRKLEMTKPDIRSQTQEQIQHQFQLWQEPAYRVTNCCNGSTRGAPPIGTK